MDEDCGGYKIGGLSDLALSQQMEMAGRWQAKKNRL